MVSRITLGKHGLPEYLESGIKSGSTLSREEKDIRLHIDGSIDALKDSIYFCQSKGWKNSYYHVTLSFTHEEWEKIESEGRSQDIVQRYLQLVFPNHDISELCYHAEAHVPLIKYEPFVSRGKNDPRVGTEGDMMERFPHIHVGVSLQNLQYTRQIAAGGILGKANKKDSEKFKQCCDEILSVEFDLIDAVARDGKEAIKRSSYEENYKTWKKFEHAAKQRTKGKELESTFDPAKDFTEIVFEDLAKTVEPIKESKKEEPKLSDVAAAKLKNLARIYNPSDVEKKMDTTLMKKFVEMDVDKFIPYFAAYFSIPQDKIRKHESQNKLELYRNESKKWVKFSATDFCVQELKLGKDEAMKLLTIFSSLESSGKGVEGLYGMFKERRYVKNIANTAMDELGWKFENLPKVSLSVSRDLESQIPNAKEKKSKNPKKPTYSAFKGYKNESNTLIGWAKELDSEKIAGYSVANFSHGIRRNDNIESLNPVIILDVDNHEGWQKEQQLTIEDIKVRLEEKNISALILPTASHSKEVNRFRTIIPTTKAFQIQGEYENWRDDYAAYVQSFVDSLELEESKAKAIDSIKATPAQFYFGSPSDAEAILTNGKTFDNSQILDAVYNERERINSDVKLKNQEKDNLAIKSEIEVYIKNQDENLSKLDIGVDNDKALTRTVFKNINSTIDILDAAKLRYPNSKILREGRYQILYTGDSERDGNRNLIANRGVFNFASRKIRTPFDFLKEYLELLNHRIKEFNNGFMIPMDRKENLKNFLTNNPLVVKETEQPLEFRKIDTRNGNNYAKLIKQKFPEKYSQICLINYSGIVKNLQKYMKSINDIEGLEQFKNHYGLKFIDIKGGKIGFRDDLSLEKLKANGLSDDWLTPPKPKPLEKNFRTPAIKISNNDEMNF